MIGRIKRRLQSELNSFNYKKSYYLSRIANQLFSGLNNKAGKVGICLFCKDENSYLEEWMTYHRGIGFDYFFIYDNLSKVPLAQTLSGVKDCEVTVWEDNAVAKQLRAYYDCCVKHTDFDWLLFIDTDEFLILKKHKMVQDFLKGYKFFQGIGLNWINYTSSGFEDRVEWFKYNKHLALSHPENTHIKSFINPKYVKSVPKDPHKFPVVTVNEHKQIIRAPLHPHSSDIAFIKHNITRSKNEYIEKIKRGRGDGMQTGHSMAEFDRLNNESV